MQLTWKRASWSGTYWAKTAKFKYAVDKPGSRWAVRIWTQPSDYTLSKLVEGDDDFATMRDAKAYAQKHADAQEAAPKPRIWTGDEHPELDPLAELPAVAIAAAHLREGMVLLDPELKTPGASLDKRVPSAQHSGAVSFLIYDYDDRSYKPLSLHRNASVWVAAQ